MGGKGGMLWGRGGRETEGGWAGGGVGGGGGGGGGSGWGYRRTTKGIADRSREVKNHQLWALLIISSVVQDRN